MASTRHQDASTLWPGLGAATQPTTTGRRDLTVGIDPGKDGAVVALDETGTVVRQVCTADLLHDHQYAPALLARAVAEILAVGVVRLAAVEAVSGRPGEGRGSMLTIGYGAGLWVGLLAGRGVPTIRPAPATWTRPLRDVPGQGKARAVAYAGAYAPGLDLTPGRRRKPHTGLADAACLALYARTRLS